VDPFSLALGTLGGAAAVRALAELREHRAAATGLADLLNWGFMVDDGVLLQKDGSLLAGWRYRGPDLSAATPQELTALSQHVNDALLPLTDDWMFHVDALRRPAVAYAPSRFPDPVTQVIDDERRAAYDAQASRQFETEYCFVATHLPPPDAFSRLRAFFLQGAERARVDWRLVLEGFSDRLRELEGRLGGPLALERLDADHLLTHLHECLTGLAHPVRTPPRGSYVNVVLADQELLGGFAPRVGRMAVRAVAVQGFPEASHAGQGTFLNTLPCAFRWSHRVIPLGTEAAAKQIRRHQLQWFKKRKGAAAWVQELFGGKRDGVPRLDDSLWVDRDALAAADDAAEAMRANAGGKVRFCYSTQVAIVMEPDAARADFVAGTILKALNEAGFPGRIETVNALEAYLGSLPGHGYPNLRRPLLSTHNIADLLPVTSVWPGLATNPSPYFPPQSPPLLWAASEGDTPFRVNLHDSDVGHTLVLGKTGSGKSVLLALLAAQFRRYPCAQVFAFDVGYSLWALARAAGARHYDLAAGSVDALKFQPLAGIHESGERVWAAEWVETVVRLQGVVATPPLRGRIEWALQLLASNDPPNRTLSEFTANLQDETLRAALHPYGLDGPYGKLLDAGADDLVEGRFQVFEMKHLFELDQRIALPVLLYLFRRIEARLDGGPTLIVIDEAWMALTHSLFGARVNQWLLQLRKQNAAVVLATQSPAQLAQLAHRHTILDSCVTKIYLPNPDAAAGIEAPLYRELGLNEREIAIIAGATPKRHYYLKAPRGSRLFELGLGPVALSFLASDPGASPEDTRRHLESLIALHGPHWPAARLDERGLGAWAERLRTNPPAPGEARHDTALALATPA
jgi:type IV secretion/conjugal transfer VirB4 family ATPase